MKYLLTLFAINFCLWGCAPGSNSGINSSPKTPNVDEASYKAIIDVSWCQPLVAQLPFRISWVFRKPDAVYRIMTNLATKKSESVKKNWRLTDKTLSILDSTSGVEILKKDVRFAIDMTTGSNLMLWSTPKDSPACKDGNCSNEIVEVMTLTNCNPEE